MNKEEAPAGTFVKAILTGLPTIRDCIDYFENQLRGNTTGEFDASVCRVIHPVIDPGNPGTMSITVQVNLEGGSRVIATHTDEAGIQRQKELTCF